MLFAMVGVFGLVFEFWRHCHFSSRGFFKMAAHRTMLGLFYFWIGCCAIGGLNTDAVGAGKTLKIHDSTISMKLLELAVGYCAWIVAAFNLLTSCCLGEQEFEEEGNDEEKAALVKSKSKGGLPGLSPWSYLTASPEGKNDSLKSQQGASFQSRGSQRTDVSSTIFEETSQENWSFQSQADEPRTADAPSADVETPPGGWSYSAAKPFGAP
jgi:hypothetical protein